MPLVLQLLKNCTRCPNCVAFLGFPFKQGKLISDVLTGVAIQVHKENKTDCLGFLLIDDEHAFTVQVVTEQLRCQKDTSAKTHLNGSIQDCAFIVAFLLCGGSHKRKLHIASTIESEYTLGLKQNANRWVQGFKLTNIADAVHNITSKSRYALCNNKVYSVSLAIGNHALELFTMHKRSTGDAFIGIDIDKLPTRVTINHIKIVVLLKLIGRCLSRISRRYSGVHGNPSQFRLFENVIFR